MYLQAIKYLATSAATGLIWELLRPATLHVGREKFFDVLNLCIPQPDLISAIPMFRSGQNVHETEETVEFWQFCLSIQPMILATSYIRHLMIRMLQVYLNFKKRQIRKSDLNDIINDPCWVFFLLNATFLSLSLSSQPSSQSPYASLCLTIPLTTVLPEC